MFLYFFDNDKMSEQPATWEALFDELEKIEPKPINLSTTPGVVAWGKFYHVINGFIALVSKPHKKEDLDKGWFFVSIVSCNLFSLHSLNS